MQRLVSDTHAFLWNLYQPTRLGPLARKAFEAADAGEVDIYLPAVVVAEALMVAQKERIPGVTLARLLAQMKIIEKANSFYQLTALQPALVLSSHRLTPIPDIFDRLVVAEAIERGTALITRDATIPESGLVETVWD